MRTFGRIAVLAVSAAGCAALSGFAALYVLVLLQPRSNNAAYGMSAFRLLGDPFVAVVFRTIVGGAALAGFVISLWALWRVQLRKAVPVGYAVTIISAMVGELVHPLGGPVLALSAAIGYMLYCHGNEAWAIRESRLDVNANGAT
jgi:hypothetical protein